MAQIQLTITAYDADDLRVTLAGLLGDVDRLSGTATGELQVTSATSPDVTEPVKAKKKTEAKKTEAPATDAPAAETPAISTGEARMDPAQEALAEAEAKETTEASTLDYHKDVVPLVLEVNARTDDRNWIANKIREYGGEAATRASDIPPDKMPLFVADCRAKLEQVKS